MSACRVHSSVAIYTVPGPQVLQSMQYKTLATSKRDGILDKFKIQGKEQSSIREMSLEVDLIINDDSRKDHKERKNSELYLKDNMIRVYTI